MTAEDVRLTREMRRKAGLSSEDIAILEHYDRKREFRELFQVLFIGWDKKPNANVKP